MRRNLSLVTLTLLVALAGCLDPEPAATDSVAEEPAPPERTEQQAQFAGNGQWGAGEIDSKTLDCDADGRISFATNGQGTLLLEVTDSSGTTIFSREFAGQGNDAIDDPLNGVPGSWTATLTAEPSGPLPFLPAPAYQGNFAGHFAC